ncbi:ABC transporter ATP-binding protein [Rugosimonospora africana]|uniref:ABC transporter ATP-binding protein n=1 Tax=Rugosimonospora africana TaxID=556532 RepID=UPI0035713291
MTKVRRQGRARVTVIDAVSLEIRPGEMVAVTGPSGAGKSTLLQLVGALDRPEAGSVLFDETDLATLSHTEAARVRRDMGFVFQHYHLLTNLSALDNVLAPLLPRRVGFDRRRRAAQLLDAVGLGGRADALARELSGGEQQRVAIARALVGRPRLVLADEPTGGLDSATGEDILDLLTTAQAEYGMTLLLATHDPSVAAQCEREIRLRDGAIVADQRIFAPEPDATLRQVTRPG